MGLRLSFLVLLIVFTACGSSADKISTKTADDPLGKGGSRQTEPGGIVEEPSSRTSVQIACESTAYAGISLTNSLLPPGTIFSDLIPPLEFASSRAPSILSANGNDLAALFTSGGRIYHVSYDFSIHRSQDAVALASVADYAESIYSQLRLPSPRLAALSPNGKSLVINTTQGFSVRSVQNPAEEIDSMPVGKNLAQLRWQGNQIFVDVVGKTLKQGIVQLYDDGSYRKMLTAPAPLRKDLQQIGLRPLGDGSYVWLEWSKNRTFIRSWNPEKNMVRDFPVSDEFGPGFALWRNDSGSLQLVMNTSRKISFFEWMNGALVEKNSVSYPEVIVRQIENNERESGDWRPGAVYSAASESQLFVNLPFGGAFQLIAIDGGKTFRPLGQLTCLNPDFYLLRNE